jgi:hypothetical protein
MVQVYKNDEIFLDTLEDFVSSGIDENECVILIATEDHLNAIEERLAKQDIVVDDIKATGQYLPLDAEEVLSTFMINGWPDDRLFEKEIGGLLSRVSGETRPVRAFGEMVALLCEQRNYGATVRLEYLWSEMCEKRKFSLLCAYPKSGFTEDANISIQTICATHSKVIHGESFSPGEILYTTPRYV